MATGTGTGLERYFEEILEEADIRVNGSRPWDIQVHNRQLYPRVVCQGSLGLGEAYMDGWWDADALDEFFHRLIRSGVHRSVRYNLSVLRLYLHALLSNPQSKQRSGEVGRRHYDIGNDLYRVMLDKRMVYTGAIWEGAETLDQAQENKLERICRLLNLQEGDHVLDIGCGWGSFAKYAAQTRGARVTGVTISREQVYLGRELCRGLPIEIRLMDYRDLDVDEVFDHVVSLGMIEHVGSRNYRQYIEKVSRCLSPDGKFLLQSIGSGISVRNTDPWINRYIFPNSMIPSVVQLGMAFERRMIVENWCNFGQDYDRTLMAWYRNFSSGWEGLKQNYSERFYRMWTYYLLMCAGSFRARHNQLWQILLSNHPEPAGAVGSSRSASIQTNGRGLFSFRRKPEDPVTT